MASETLCLFAFVVNPSPCFHAHSTGGAYHLAKPNSPGKNGWNFMRKWSKRPPQDMYLEGGVRGVRIPQYRIKILAKYRNRSYKWEKVDVVNATNPPFK